MSAYIKSLFFDDLSFRDPPLQVTDSEGLVAFAFRQSFDKGGNYKICLPASGPHILQVGLIRAKTGGSRMVFSLYSEEYLLIARRELPVARLVSLCDENATPGGARLSLGLRMGLTQVLREEIGAWFVDRQCDLFPLLAAGIRKAVVKKGGGRTAQSNAPGKPAAIFAAPRTPSWLKAA